MMERWKKWKKKAEKRNWKGNVVVIRPNAPDYGFFAHFINILGKINEIILAGGIPCVDMKSNKSVYIEEEEVGCVNAWEQFFEQPCVGVSVEKEENRKIFVKRNIVDYNGSGVRPSDSMEFLTNEAEISYWRKLVGRYIHFNTVTEDYIKEVKKKIGFCEDDRVVGVLVRGTDFVNKRPWNHPIPPTAEEAAQMTQKIMMEYKCSKIFLATEDQKILEIFEKQFGKNILLTVPQERYKDTGTKCLDDVYKERKEDVHVLGRNYVATIKILSECRCLLLSRTSGAIASLLIGGGV